MTRLEFAVKVKDEAVANAAKELRRVKSLRPEMVLDEKLCEWWTYFADNQQDGMFGLSEAEDKDLRRVFHRMSFDMTSIRDVAILVWNQWIDERVAAGETTYYKLKLSRS